MARARLADPADTNTATAILDIAERLVQRRGFSGFSYADIAAELGITKASLHYHFPSKAELGESLITRYADRFGEALMEIEGRDGPATDKLRAYCASTEPCSRSSACACAGCWPSSTKSCQTRCATPSSRLRPQPGLAFRSPRRGQGSRQPQVRRRI